MVSPSPPAREHPSSTCLDEAADYWLLFRCQISHQIPDLLIRESVQQSIGHDRNTRRFRLRDLTGEQLEAVPLLVDVLRYVQVRPHQQARQSAFVGGADRPGLV